MKFGLERIKMLFQSPKYRVQYKTTILFDLSLCLTQCRSR